MRRERAQGCCVPGSACARRGFTFVEILAAMLFMAIVIPVTAQGILLINRLGAAAGRKRQAVELADRVLNEALATDSWRTGSLGGDFKDEAPGFRYEIATADWAQGGMTQLTAKVYYSLQGQEFSEELSTLALLNTTDDVPPAATASATTTNNTNNSTGNNPGGGAGGAGGGGGRGGQGGGGGGNGGGGGGGGFGSGNGGFNGGGGGR